MAFDPALASKVVRFVELSSALGKRAIDELAVHETARKKASQRVSPMVEHMVAAGVIGSDQKQAAAGLLRGHDTTFDLLKSAVDKIQQLNKEKQAKAASDMGRGVDETLDDPNRSLTSPFVGVPTSEKKASDIAYLRGLGISA